MSKRSRISSTLLSQRFLQRALLRLVRQHSRTQRSRVRRVRFRLLDLRASENPAGEELGAGGAADGSTGREDGWRWGEALDGGEVKWRREVRARDRVDPKLRHEQLTSFTPGAVAAESVAAAELTATITAAAAEVRIKVLISALSSAVALGAAVVEVASAVAGETLGFGGLRVGREGRCERVGGVYTRGERSGPSPRQPIGSNLRRRRSSRGARRRRSRPTKGGRRRRQ